MNLTSKEILDSLETQIAMAINCANAIQHDTMESARMSLNEKEIAHVNAQKIINAGMKMRNLLKDCQPINSIQS